VVWIFLIILTMILNNLYLYIIYKMESGFMMFIHSVIITIILYVIMKFIFKQSASVAQDRSILIGALVLVYMILYGHGLPGRINSNIF
jgi:hypothetical protein